MQPDLLSPEKEKNQPDALPQHDMTPSPEAAQHEIAPTEKAAGAGQFPTVEKKRSKLNLAYIGLGVLVFLLFAAFAWVGYWAYSLSTELTATQQQLATLQTNYAQLQTEYASLKTENERLTAEITQTRADLEKANADLAASREAASKSRDENQQLTTQIDKAGKLAQVLQTFASIQDEADFLVLAKQINDADNEGLSNAWAKATTFPSEESFNEFLNYLILAIRDSLQ